MEEEPVIVKVKEGGKAYHSDFQPKFQDFVIVVNVEKGNTVRINDLDELKAFLYTYDIDELTKCVWESIRYSYRSGQQSKKKHIR